MVNATLATARPLSATDFWDTQGADFSGLEKCRKTPLFREACSQYGLLRHNMRMLEPFRCFLHSDVSLFSGMLGAVTTLVLLSVGKFLARPRLVLSFDGSSDAYMATSTHREGDEPSVTRKYLRVSLRAAGLFGTILGGSSGAAKCLIYITAIRPVVNGIAGNDQLYDARPVSWPPNKTFDPRHIPRGITMFANVVTMREGHLDWNFQVPNQYGLNSVRSHAGTSRFRIAAIAENAKPVSIAIDASIKADKSGFQTRLVKR